MTQQMNGDANDWDEIQQMIALINDNVSIDASQFESEFKTKRDELMAIVKDMKTKMKEKDKFESQIESMRKGIEKAQGTIDTYEMQKNRYNDDIAMLTQRCADKRANTAEAMSILGMIGIRIEKKDDILLLNYTKICPKNAQMEFTVHVKFDDTYVKILESKPSNLLEWKVIEDHFNETRQNGSIDLRYLIWLIRDHLKRAVDV